MNEYDKAVLQAAAEVVQARDAFKVLDSAVKAKKAHDEETLRCEVCGAVASQNVGGINADFPLVKVYRCPEHRVDARQI